MAVFAIGDLHLSLGGDKPMDVFPGWEGYARRIEQSWREQVREGDTVVLDGDTCWGMSLEEARADFEFLQALPGRKILDKGNHDYWWSTKRKMDAFFLENGLDSFEILHNNCIAADGLLLCGTRGWMLEDGAPSDKKVSAREAGRLSASLRDAEGREGERVVFLHYPPLYRESLSGDMIDLMLEYRIKRCYYGHLHGVSCRTAFEGEYLGICFSLISADHLGFSLKKIT